MMMLTTIFTKRQWIIALIGFGLTCIAAGVLPLIATAQSEGDEEPTATIVIDDEAEFDEEVTLPPVDEASPPADDEASSEPTAVVIDEPTAEPATSEPAEAEGEVTPAPEVTSEAVNLDEITITGDNSYCLLCHGQPGRVITLASGDTLNLFVSTDTIDASIHGTRNEIGQLGCIDCHGADSFPHRAPSPSDTREYTLDAVQMCIGCHTEDGAELDGGLHAEAIRDGDLQAAVCTDCHGAHDAQSVSDHPELVATVCGDCHVTTLQEWTVSAHAEMSEPGCSTCHSPHSQRLRVSDSTDALCMNCHEDMDTLLVHEQHTDDDYPVDCVDCHMYVDAPEAGVTLIGDPVPTGHSMLMNTTPCTTCHETLVENGDWQVLVANNRIPIPETALIEPSSAETEAVEGSDDFVQVLQGLILGAGFGATVAAIFVARGNRSVSHQTAAEPVASSHAEIASENASETPSAPSVDDISTPSDAPSVPADEPESKDE